MHAIGRRGALLGTPALLAAGAPFDPNTIDFDEHAKTVWGF